MNDFTKEELNQIIYCLGVYDVCIFDDEIEYDNLNIRNKLQSLIDSYCEHNDYEKLYTSAAGVENFRCKDCCCQFIYEPIAYKRTIVG